MIKSDTVTNVADERLVVFFAMEWLFLIILGLRLICSQRRVVTVT